MKAGLLPTTLVILLVTFIATCVQGQHLAFACPAGNGVTILIRRDGKADFGTTPGSVMYDKAGRISRIGNMAISYDSGDRIVKVGTVGVLYDAGGRVKNIGSIPVGYDKAGRLVKIGMAAIKYYPDGSVKTIGAMDGTLMFLGTD